MFCSVWFDGTKNVLALSDILKKMWCAPNKEVN